MLKLQQKTPKINNRDHKYRDKDINSSNNSNIKKKIKTNSKESIQKIDCSKKTKHRAEQVTLENGGIILYSGNTDESAHKDRGVAFMLNKKKIASSLIK